jgi:signal transduction histidine kinase
MMLIVAISIMVAETAIMFLFELLPQMSALVGNFVDGISLTILLSPILYLFLFRPLSMHVSALGQAEKSLRQQNEELKEKSRQLLEAQDELVRNEKLALLGQIADTVGHELRNPLGVMNNAVYFLQTVLVDADATTKEYLGIIKEEIVDAERIVSDLLDAVRTKPPHPEMTEVAELIRQALRKGEAPSRVTVKLDIPKNISPVQVDSMQMHQVFWNLITNGMEAMPDGGALEIKADEDKAAKTVTVSIKDSGSGIAPEQQGKLFQPMYTTKARRVGLGLVVVKNLTQANGGSVGVESVLGEGSTFAVTLPCGGG